MPNTVLIGAQWGDEGKGKIVDVLTREADVVVRFQGGNNAGHTVEIGGEQYILHLVPSGILHPDKICVIGNGVVVNAVALVEEIRGLRERGLDAQGRLFVSDRAQIVFPYHGRLDEALEGRRRGGARIGTTKRGIGPAYGDKVMRVGLRMGDLLDPEFGELLEECVAEKNRILAGMGGEQVDYASLRAAYGEAAAFLASYICDTVVLLNGFLRDGRAILFEGAQGTMLDVDFGTFPFVTSSNATAGGACTGTGVPPNRIDRVIGVIKAYTTRVGEGPLPTELQDATGRHLSRRGQEFGATTGRPRRCGWFDAVVARHSAMINGVDHWAVTKLDVLDGLPALKICTAYEADGRRFEHVPANTRLLARCRPVYEEWPGWRADTRGITRIETLPPEARAYLDRLCELTGVPMGMLSLGPGREATLRIGF